MHTLYHIINSIRLASMDTAVNKWFNDRLRIVK